MTGTESSELAILECGTSLLRNNLTCRSSPGTLPKRLVWIADDGVPQLQSWFRNGVFFSFFGILEWCSSSKLADITPRSCHCRQRSMDGLPFGFHDVELDVD